MGFGDFKLLSALGAWMGWQMLPLVVLMSSFVGTVLDVGMIVLRGRDRNIPLPFGPYLAIAGWLCLLCGDQLVARSLAFGVSNFSVLRGLSTGRDERSRRVTS